MTNESEIQNQDRELMNGKQIKHCKRKMQPVKSNKIKNSLKKIKQYVNHKNTSTTHTISQKKKNVRTNIIYEILKGVWGAFLRLGKMKKTTKR